MIGNDARKGAPSVGLSPTVSSISQKLGALKKALQFDPSLKSRLDNAHSSQELLDCVQDEILSRLACLREIGLIGQDSYQALEALKERREKLRDPEARHLTERTISTREQALTEENAHLHKRLQAQRAQLKIAAIQQKTLISAQETIKSLRDRNSALRSKVEYQARMLQSLPIESAGYQEALLTMEKLTEENRQLKARFEGLCNLLSQLQLRLPADARVIVQDLMEKSAGLVAMLEGRSAQLDDAFIETGQEAGQPLQESIERLNEENVQLKRILQAKPLIDKFIEAEKKGREGDPAPIIAALSEESRSLERALREREEQLRLLADNASNKALLKALQRLRDENGKLLKDVAHKEQVCKQLAAELKDSQGRIRDRQLLIQENQSLKNELESAQRQVEALKTRSSEYLTLKKDYAEALARYPVLAAQYRKVSDKLAKLAEEHDMLIREYEKLFIR